MDGGTTTKQILVTINDIINKDTIDEITPPDQLTQIAKEVVGDDTYDSDIMEMGYIFDENNNPISTYSVGTITPEIVIDQYISNRNRATYTGKVAALVTNPNGDTVKSGGSVILNVDFGQQNFTGNINITQGNWQAKINSGTVTNTGFTTTNISSATTSSVSDITGAITKGKFYGATAQNVGGDFNLNSTTKGSVNGSFGGKK